MIAMTAVAGVIGAAPVGTAFAADSGADSADQATQTQSGDFSDKQLKQFVKAQGNVQSVMKEWQPKIAKADGDDQKQTLQKQENDALVKAVKSSGLDPEVYNQIANQARNDPKLTERIQSFMTPQ
ncbi:DUF4168 domain-containing protein [Salinisphaera sp. Q1T1-3]|nr:DUF4168 domain-containing protein [Salinisphaera sp. Q1T1-3]